MNWTAKELLSLQVTYCSEQLAMSAVKSLTLQLVGTKGSRRYRRTGQYLILSMKCSLVAAVRCYAVCSDFHQSGASFNRKFAQKLKCQVVERKNLLIRAGTLAVFMPQKSPST